MIGACQTAYHNVRSSDGSRIFCARFREFRYIKNVRQAPIFDCLLHVWKIWILPAARTKIKVCEPVKRRTTMWEAQTVWEYSVRDLGSSDTSKMSDRLRFSITRRRFVESWSCWVRILSRTTGTRSLSPRNECLSVTTVRNLQGPIHIDVLNRLCHLYNLLKRYFIEFSRTWIKNILFYFCISVRSNIKCFLE